MAEEPTKRCTKCDEDKPLTDFHRNGRWLRSHCKACARVADAERYDPVRAAEWSSAWYAENADRKAVTVKAWCRANPEARRRICRTWASANPGKVAAKAGRRNAAKVQATPAWADQDAIRRLYESAALTGCHVDHIVPLRSRIVCGLHVEANLEPLPPGENIAKGNRWWPDMWGQPEKILSATTSKR